MMAPGQPVLRAKMCMAVPCLAGPGLMAGSATARMCLAASIGTVAAKMETLLAMTPSGLLTYGMDATVVVSDPGAYQKGAVPKTLDRLTRTCAPPMLVCTTLRIVQSTQPSSTASAGAASHVPTHAAPPFGEACAAAGVAMTATAQTDRS